MVNPWIGMGLVLAIYGTLMLGLEAYRRSRSPDPELVRKCLHLGMGLLTLSFPWLFASPWPVVLLAALFTAWLAILRTFRSLQRLRGGVIDGVNRKSLGEIYFPLAVGLVYLLSAGDPLTFCIPMLILSLADAAAALVGERYGTLRYPTAGQRKSLEGSMAFFTVAFLSAHIPLLLFTDAGRPANLLISMTLALLLTLVEAMAPGGLDNLGIPLVALLLLRSLLGLDVAALVVRLGVAVLLATLVALLACRGIPLNQEGSPERSRLSSRFPPGTTEGSGDGIV